MGRSDNIIDQACLKCNEKIPERVEYFSIRKYFIKNTLCGDIYLIFTYSSEPYMEDSIQTIFYMK